ncbi:MAG: hypothetical protein RLZZ324_789 [Candidatus Parcubacteria bacterium]|jgi:glycosyltransferase involved in cell wall biosynthesis
MRVAAVIPAYKEKGRIGDVVRAMLQRADRVFVVDDGSGDGTGAEARVAGAEVLTHALNRGQGAALRTGVDAALEDGADVIVHVDADGQHDPDAVPALLAPIRAGDADIVLGSRFMGVNAEGMPASRRALLWAARQFSSGVLGITRTLTDPTNGMRAMTAAAARDIDFRQDRMAHCTEILRLISHSRWLARTREVPVKVRYTADTLAKGQKAGDAFKVVWQMVIGSFND